MIPFCRQYVSNTTAGMAVQSLFNGDGCETLARVYARLTHSGEEHALLFSGTVDTTYADGSRTVVGDVCDPFTLYGMRVGVCDSCDMDEASEPSAWQTVTFGGDNGATMKDGDWLTTDPIAMHVSAGETLCIEYRFIGAGRIPCHPELQIPSFVKEGDAWVPSPMMPIPVMIGVKRAVRHRVAFLGDSITQGIGATSGAYRHWVALVADKLGADVACWNLGIGFARSGDAAANGTWLARAKQNDVVVLCLGVNDILRGISREQIVQNIETIIERLRDAGCRVLLQSVPPFEFSPEQWATWRAVNLRIQQQGDRYFMNYPLLCNGDCPRYGGHPNDEGCEVWAKAIVPLLRDMLFVG